MSYTYIKANHSDKELLYKVFSTVMKEFIIKIWGWDEDWQLNDFDSNYLRENIITVKNGTDIVGYCQYEEKTNHLFIRMLVVLPEHQSNGIGKHFLLLLSKIANKKSKRMQLYVFKINAKARLFYEKHGFNAIGETDTSYIMELNA